MSSYIPDKSDYNPAKHPVVTLSTLNQVVRMWIADVYHQQVHHSLKTTRRRMWKQSEVDDAFCLDQEREAQVDIQALHRVLDFCIGRRTAVINPLRGFLLEHGITLNTAQRSQTALDGISQACLTIMSSLLDLPTTWKSSVFDCLASMLKT